jgi:hypothetical protein
MATMKSRNMAVFLLSAVVLSAMLAACARDSQALSPQTIEQQYGVSGAYVGQISTPDGPLKGTIVPVTLADGRKAQLAIPQAKNDPHGAYLQDASGTYPVQVNQSTTRQEVVQSPTVVATVPDPQHPNQRSWEKQALIIGGTAGAGAAIGAIAGGGKGAGIGAAAGGVGGLIYDLVTRNKN